MKIYTSKISLFVFLGLSVAICVVPSYFFLSLAVDQYARGFFFSVFLLSLFTVLTYIPAIYLARSAFISLKLAHLPVLNFFEGFVTYRDPDSTKTVDIPYEQIDSAVITENLSKYAPSRLVVTQANGSKISIEPTFDQPKEVVMEQFEKHCSFLRRRYKWQWSKLYRTGSKTGNV